MTLPGQTQEPTTSRQLSMKRMYIFRSTRFGRKSFLYHVQQESMLQTNIASPDLSSGREGGRKGGREGGREVLKEETFSA